MPQSKTTSKSDSGPTQLKLFAGEFDTWTEDDSAGRTNGNAWASTELKLAGDDPSPPVTDLLCPSTVKFMQVFEAVSGWEVHFQKSLDSDVAVSADQQALPPQGKFEIIDMSMNWPAQTPTMHRGKCDQLIELFNDIYNQFNATKENLNKTKGLLTALTSPPEDDDELVDTFAPMFTDVITDDDSGFVLSQDNDFGDEYESAFVVKQEFDSNCLPETFVWNDWAIAGASGIAGETYLDWTRQGDVLTVYVGRIESSFGVGDTESSLEVNAVSHQFKVSQDNTMAAFFLWDRRGGQLRSVEPGTWQTLYSQCAIIVSTNPDVQMPDSVVNAELGAAPFTADQLAAAIEAKLDADDRLMVIKCD